MLAISCLSLLRFVNAETLLLFVLGLVILTEDSFEESVSVELPDELVPELLDEELLCEFPFETEGIDDVEFASAIFGPVTL